MAISKKQAGITLISIALIYALLFTPFVTGVFNQIPNLIFGKGVTCTVTIDNDEIIGGNCFETKCNPLGTQAFAPLFLGINEDQILLKLIENGKMLKQKTVKVDDVFGTDKEVQLSACVDKDSTSVYFEYTNLEDGTFDSEVIPIVS